MSQSRPAGKKYATGLTFGGFDLLHLGHINLLKAASERCDRLIVAVSSETYLYEKKGIKTFLDLRDRMQLVQLSGYADIVTNQATLRTKRMLVDEYKPDVLFVGDDWTPETYEGEDLGVPVEYLPHTFGISTGWYRERLFRSDGMTNVGDRKNEDKMV